MLLSLSHSMLIEVPTEDELSELGSFLDPDGDGEMTFKGSEAHKAAVTGDTVGDPFKDTSGPSMNILIKLTCLIGLVIAPILGGHSESSKAIHNEMNKEIIVEVNGDHMAKAVIITSTTKDGETVTEEQVVEGTKEEVEAVVETVKEEIEVVEKH